MAKGALSDRHPRSLYAAGLLRKGIEEQLARSLAEGARLLTSGSRPYDRGWFLSPAVVDGCNTSTTCFREESSARSQVSLGCAIPPRQSRWRMIPSSDSLALSGPATRPGST
jgi:hypothetical protein